MMLTPEQIAHLMGQMNALGLAELNYEHGDTKLRLVAASAPLADAPLPGTTDTTQAHSPVTAATPLPAPVEAYETIEAPMHGAFYTTPSPDRPAFVNAGQCIEAGTTLCILEVMKTLSRLEAEFPCEIIEVLAKNGENIEPGTPLFRVRRLDV